MRDYIREAQVTRISDYDLYVGMDVDKTRIAVTVNDRDTTLKSLAIPYDAGNLLSFIKREYPFRRIVFAYEAGPTGFGLYDAISEAGYGCLVASPGGIPSAPNNRVKTNRLDSKKLAELLAGNRLNGIRVPSESIRELRALVHLRYTYMQDIRAYKCRIKGHLLLNGIPFPPCRKGSQWTKAVIAALRALSCSRASGVVINSMLDHLEDLRKRLKLIEIALERFISGDEELCRCVAFLMSCPGIGFRIACYVLARVGDWRRLGRSQETSAFFGLVPCENSTGDRTDRGSITKCGDPRLRSMVIQGAWAAIRKDRELNAMYERICANHPKRLAARVAIVAVARSLAQRMHSVLKEQRPYDVRAAA